MVSVDDIPKNEFLPVDKWRIVRIVFFLHGISALLPWNMLINADSYFVDYKLNPGSDYWLANVDNSSNHLRCLPNMTVLSNGLDCAPKEEEIPDELESYRLNFLPYLSTASKLPNIIFQLLNLLFSSSYKSYSIRLKVTFIVQIGLFVVMIVLAFLDTSTWPIIFFWITMLIAVLFNIANGLFQSCMYGIVAKFPMSYINMVTLGFSFSGTIASIFYIVSLLLSPHPKIVAIYYFTLATVFMAVCFVNELVISKNIFYQYFVTLEEKKRSKKIQETSCYTLTSYDNHLMVTDLDCPDNLEREINANNSDIQTNGHNEPKTIFCQQDSVTEHHGLDKYRYILRKSWVQLLNIILIYVSTFCTFPTIQAGILPVGNLISVKFFAPIFCFLFYNLFSTIGNFVAERVLLPKANGVIYCVLLRFIFIPFFMLCNFLPDKRVWPILINSDAIYALGAILVSFTNGYLSSLTMMYAPKCVPPAYASTAAMLASAAVIIGILIGVQCSMLLLYIITN